MSGVSDTLVERGKRYGTLMSNAVNAQRIKAVLHTSVNWPDLASDQKEALDVIASKIARILSGDPNYVDNWHDIQGYALLVEQRLLSEAAPKVAGTPFPTLGRVTDQLARDLPAQAGPDKYQAR